MQVNNSQPSFGSTKVYNIGKMTISELVGPVEKYFEVKPVWHKLGGVNTSQDLADKIDFSQATFVLENGAARFVGKDGGPGGADTFIGRILKEAFPNNKVEYIDDVAPIKVDGPVIDMTEIGKILDTEI